MESMRAADELKGICSSVSDEFRNNRRILTFGEYLDLFLANPVRHSRDAAAFVSGAFDHFGTRDVVRPWGTQTGFKLFDLPWLEAGESRQCALVGQESVQSELYRVLQNFVREGRPNRLPVLHGPNGSAKSTIALCLMRALEHYSTLDEGALYRFHWVFPSRRTVQGSIGFGEPTTPDSQQDSYAHLPEDQVDSRLFVEVRDHPLFLIPREQRVPLLERAAGLAGKKRLSRRVYEGELSHKNKEVFEALLSSYEGNLSEVLKHVQVERYFISRKYRCGAVTIGPQLSVDAGERQITSDRSLGALPSSLQAITLFEAFGELIEASGGILEFADLLKRPLDAFKYLQQSVETGEVNLRSQNVPLNCVMLASANELQLAAFREHPEYQSFRARLELVRSPYLRSWRDEQEIYDAQIAPQVRKHVAPHATRMAAMFAVLTRMRKPASEQFDEPMAELVKDITAFEKMELYSGGSPPERLSEDARKALKAAIPQIYSESDSYAIYEGGTGASPREMRGVLLDAAQHPDFSCLSPFAVLQEIEALCRRTNEYEWLREGKQSGGYHDFQDMLQELRKRLLVLTENDFRQASGLVDDASYSDLLERYVEHVSHWVKGEKLVNPLTGDMEPPNELLMKEVEGLLESPDSAEKQRHGLINAIAAWAIEHPDQAIQKAPVYIKCKHTIRDSVFSERRVQVARLTRNVLTWAVSGPSVGSDRDQDKADKCLKILTQDLGYSPESAADAARVLVQEQFSELLS